MSCKGACRRRLYGLAQRGCSQRRIAKDLGVNRERWAGICGCRNQPFRSPAIYQEAGDWSRWPPYSKRSSSRNSGLTFPFCLKCERDRRYEFRNAWRARSSGEDTSTNAAICRIPRPGLIHFESGTPWRAAGERG